MCLALVALLIALSAASMPHDIAAITDRHVVRVAMLARDEPPFFWRDRSGALRGSDVDLARDLGRALGVPVRFDRSAPTIDEVVARVADHRDDLAISKISITLQRARFVVFSNPYATIRQGLLVNRVAFEGIAAGRTTWEVLHDFRGKLGVLEGSAYDAYAQRSFPRATIVRYASWDALLGALERGAVVAAYRDEPDIEDALRREPGLTIALRVIVISDRQDRIAVAVSADAPTLLGLVNEYIAERLTQ